MQTVKGKQAQLFFRESPSTLTVFLLSPSQCSGTTLALEIDGIQTHSNFSKEALQLQHHFSATLTQEVNLAIT